MNDEYTMNPEEDEVLFTDQLRPGMMVLKGHAALRKTQEFRRVIRVRKASDTTGMILEDATGHQEAATGTNFLGWIVKKGTASKTWTVVDSDSHPHQVTADYIGHAVSGSVNFFDVNVLNKLVASFYRPVSVTEEK